MANEVITLSGMMKFFKEDINTITKGELKYKADFVLDVRVSDLVVMAKIRASMKDKSYSVKLTLDGDGGIAKGECECPRGNWICSHMAATAIYTNKKGMSKTDLPNTWIAKPKKAARYDSKTFGDLFPAPRPEYKATRRAVTTSDRELFYDQLSALSLEGIQCPMQWIVGPEPPESTSNPLAPYLIEDLVEDFINDRSAFVYKVKVSHEQIQWLANETIGQRNSILWGQYRKLRLTGSNFGHVIQSCQRRMRGDNPIPPSLLKKLRGEYQLGHKDSIMWGQMHEEVATEKYKELTGNKVTPAGLFLFPCGYLGCSPDGIIYEDKEEASNNKGILEIKCPWKHRNSTLDEMIGAELKGKNEVKSFYLTAEKELNKNHQYWHQVQGEMVAACVSWAHFVVWTNVDCKILYVEKDPLWEETFVPILSAFYLNDLLPSCYVQEV